MQSATQSSSELDALSERLTTLADQINTTNAARRSDRSPAKPLAGYLQTLMRQPSENKKNKSAVKTDGSENSQSPRNTTSAAEAVSDFDTEGRLWPTLPTPKQNRSLSLEAKLEEQSAELAERYVQIADLCNIQQTQASDLRMACEQIEVLSKTIGELREQIAERDDEIAAAMEKLNQAASENSDLQMRLNAERHTTVELSQRLLECEVSFNDRLVDITAGQETIERLRADLATAQAAIPKAAAAAKEKADHFHNQERDLQTARSDRRVGELQARVVESEQRAEKIEKVYAELIVCCNSLSKKVAALEETKAEADTTIKAQAEQIEFLETITKIERQNAEATIKELVAEFQRDRQQLLDQEKASAEIRKNIVQLLPKLSARRNPPADADTGFSEPRSQVA